MKILPVILIAGILAAAVLVIPVCAADMFVSGNGFVYITSSPKASSVYIDGNYQGVTPLNLKLFAGTHSVTISNSGYNSWYGTVVVPANGGQAEVSATLEKRAAEGYLSVNSYPAGANVYVGNIYWGNTPLTVTLSSGSYNVLVKCAGYKSYSTCVSVRDGATSYVTATLQQDTAYGYVSVVTTPVGAAVYVDGAFVGNTAGNGIALTVGPYTAGTTHAMVISANGYDSKTQQFTVTPGQTKTMTVNLGSQDSKAVTLTVTSSPSGAYIYLDNLYYGVTPVTIPNAPIGSHVLKITAAGYNDWEESIILRNGENYQKSVALSPAIPAPGPAPSPAPVFAVICGLLGAAAVFGLRRN